MAQQQITGQIGAQGPLGSGSPASPIRQGNLGDVIISELNGKYYEQALRGNMFYAVNSAAQALSLSSTTTYTGLTVANPTGSGKNLHICKAGWATTIAITGVGAVVLGTGATVAQTTGSSTGPVPTLLGAGTSSVAKVGASCTYGANPAILRPLVGIHWITGGTSTGAFQAMEDIAGEIIVAPGQQVSLVSVTTANTGIGFISWIELSSTIL